MFALLKAARKAATGAVPSGRRRKLILALPAMAALSACDPGALTSGMGLGGGVGSSGPVQVALLVPSGSGSSGDEILARSIENSTRLAMSRVSGGERVDLRVYSTAANATTAAGAAERAIAEGAEIILGPVYAESANSVGLVARGKGVNVLAFSNNTSIAGGNVFVLGPTFQNSADRVTRYAVSQGKRNIVAVYGRTPEGQAGLSAVQNAAVSAGASITASVPFEFSQNGVLDAVPNVRSVAGDGQADALFITANAAGALPLLAQLLPDAGLTPGSIQYLGLTRWDTPPQTLDLPAVQGSWFAVPDPASTGRFRAAYSAAYGGEPHPVGATAYDGMSALATLLASASPEAFSAASLTRAAGFQGSGGLFRLNADGSNTRALAIATVTDSSVQIIDPAPLSFGAAGL